MVNVEDGKFVTYLSAARPEHEAFERFLRNVRQYYYAPINQGVSIIKIRQINLEMPSDIVSEGPPMIWQSRSLNKTYRPKSWALMTTPALAVRNKNYKNGCGK